MGWRRAYALASLLGGAASSSAPTGLLCDFQKSPALGIRPAPHFTWIVPPCAAGADHKQTAYQVKVSDHSGVVWDSAKVSSSDSTYVAYAGQNLTAGETYQWTVTTWTAASGGGAPCQSSQSAPATFVTALFDGWSPSAQWIGSGVGSSTFAYLRSEVAVPAGVVSAAAFVTAVVDGALLSGYKLYIDGALIDVGPGRGEAPVWGGDGAYRSLPYTTLDVTSYFSKPRTAALALVAMHKQPAAILQVNLRLSSGELVTLATNTTTWQAFNADAHRKPGAPQHGHSAGTGFIEYIDAREEPVGWMSVGFKAGSGWAPAAAVPQNNKNLHAKMGRPMQVTNVAAKSVTPVAPRPPGPAPAPTTPVPCGEVAENQVLLLGCPGGGAIAGVEFASFGTPTGSCPDGLKADPNCDANTSAALVAKDCVGKTTCSVKADRNAFGDPCYDTVKALAVKLDCPKAPPAPPAPATPAPPPPTSFVVDFGRELQGGLRLEVEDGTAGQTAHLACGETLKGQSVGTTWGWEFDWTLRDGKQVLEQHKYMECRFVSLTFPTGGPSKWTLSAWKVHYEWDDADTHFASSNSTLDAVWELSRYTLEAASLDTYTDSNTRERRPYEADGIIAATARLMVQREYMWPRHSHAWTLQNPTWPVEWKQISPFLGWQDYMATGQPDLSMAFQKIMFDRTMYSHLDSTGLLDTSGMGRHIVDWMPNGGESDQTVKLGEYTASNHMSVSNAWAAHGLEVLSEMASAAGLKDNATDFAAKAAGLRKAMVSKMWNGSAFCDGICSEVNGASKMMSSMFTLWMGLVPQEHVALNWKVVTDWGMQQIGDYGAFWYLNALGGSYYTLPNAYYTTPSSDDGSAVLTALTKCDHFSWCSEIRDDNATMTRESWHDGTYSHPWGTGAVMGVVSALMGIHQTAPGFATFTVKPKLGNLATASITVPTLRGYVNVTAKPGAVEVHVPCNTVATLCLPRSTSDGASPAAADTHTLLLDGGVVPAVTDGGHLCTGAGVSCGAGGAPRVLTAQRR